MVRLVKAVVAEKTKKSGLAIIGQTARPAERADAARNRTKILDAAKRLLADHPIAEICMDAVAKEAGVGKGTVYRRFPDRTALCLTLLDEEARQFQEHVLSGLGLADDTSPRTRVFTFLDQLFDFVWSQRALLAEAWSAHKGGAALYDHPGHAWQRQALVTYIQAAVTAGEMSVDGNPVVVAELLLSGLHPDLIAWLRGRTKTVKALRAEYHRHWHKVLD